MTTVTEQELIQRIADDFRRVIERSSPSFSHAYWRFDSDESHYGSKGSLVDASGVSIVDVFKEAEVFDSLNETGRALWQLMVERKERFVVALLILSKSAHELRIEREDVARWPITKAMGATGVPSGL